jgi:hypothetical protein
VDLSRLACDGVENCPHGYHCDCSRRHCAPGDPDGANVCTSLDGHSQADAPRADRGAAAEASPIREASLAGDATPLDAAVPDATAADLTLPDLTPADTLRPDLPPCSGVLCNGSCVPTTNNDNACGPLGLSCAGATNYCQGSACLPAPTPTAVESAISPTLVQAFNGLLYYAQGAIIDAYNPSNQKVTVVGGSVGPPIDGLAVDANGVYYAYGGRIYRSPNGSAVDYEMADPNAAQTVRGAVVSDGQRVYFEDNASVYWCASGTSCPNIASPYVVKAGLTNPSGLAVSGQTLYFADDTSSGTIYQSASGGTPQPVVAAINQPGRIAADRNWLYFEAAPSGGTGRIVWRARPWDGIATQDGPTLVQVSGLLADGVAGYVSDGVAGGIYKLNDCGLTSTILAPSTSELPDSLAQDADSLYLGVAPCSGGSVCGTISSLPK